MRRSRSPKWLEVPLKLFLRKVKGQGHTTSTSCPWTTFSNEMKYYFSKRCPFRFTTLSERQILGSSKLKEFADDNFNFDKNGRKFSKWTENTVGKGEIARHEQFHLFP